MHASGSVSYMSTSEADITLLFFPMCSEVKNRLVSNIRGTRSRMDASTKPRNTTQWRRANSRCCVIHSSSLTTTGPRVVSRIMAASAQKWRSCKAFMIGAGRALARRRGLVGVGLHR